jgi:DNA-binding transcriptional LysR family regulator
MDRLAALEMFVAVAETQSFSQAAQKLRLSKSVVSRQIAQLESHLGVRLLQRTTRALALTEAGQTYLEHAKQIIADVSAADMSVSTLQASPRGLLRVSAPVSFGFLHLAPALPEFLNRYHDIEMDLALNDRFVDVIDEGFDIAVRIGKLTDSRLVSRRLAPSPMVLCASPAYLARMGRPSHPHDLRTHECLCYTNIPSAHEWRFLDENGKSIHVTVRGRLHINNGDALRAAALGGLGIVIVPQLMVEADLKSGALESLLAPFMIQETAIHIVYPHARLMSPKVRAFIDFLVQRFGHGRESKSN